MSVSGGLILRELIFEGVLYSRFYSITTTVPCYHQHIIHLRYSWLMKAGMNIFVVIWLAGYESLGPDQQV